MSFCALSTSGLITVHGPAKAGMKYKASECCLAKAWKITIALQDRYGTRNGRIDLGAYRIRMNISEP